MLTYAHKLSYTTFAPPRFEPGKTALGNFRPPAPQEWQMRMSQLHRFAGDSVRLAAPERGSLYGSRQQQRDRPCCWQYTCCTIMRWTVLGSSSTCPSVSLSRPFVI